MKRVYKEFENKEDVPYGTEMNPAEYARMQGVDQSRISALEHKLDCHRTLGKLKILHTLRNDVFFDNPSPRRGKKGGFKS